MNIICLMINTPFKCSVFDLNRGFDQVMKLGLPCLGALESKRNGLYLRFSKNQYLHFNQVVAFVRDRLRYDVFTCSLGELISSCN